MAILKSETNLILAGKVIPAGETFECPDSLGDSLLARGFASNLKEAIPLTPDELNAPENTPVDGDKEPEVELTLMRQRFVPIMRNSKKRNS